MKNPLARCRSHGHPSKPPGFNKTQANLTWLVMVLRIRHIEGGRKGRRLDGGDICLQALSALQLESKRAHSKTCCPLIDSTMAHNRSPLVLTAAEEDAVIRDRLITRTGMTAPITWQKKVMQRFAALSASLVSDASFEESDRLCDNLLDALKVMLLPVQKSFQGVEASRRDERLAQELHVKTLQEIADVSPFCSDFEQSPCFCETML